MRKFVDLLRNLVVLLFLWIASQGIAQKETSVLFIGNSFTFYNYMPGILKDIASANGKPMHVDTAVTGGKDLKFHSARERTYEMIKSKKWDYVVLLTRSLIAAEVSDLIHQFASPILLGTKYMGSSELPAFYNYLKNKKVTLFFSRQYCT